MEEQIKVEQPKKRNSGLAIITVFLLLLSIAMGGFIYLNKDKIFVKQTKETTEKEDSNTQKETCPEINYDLKTDEESDYGFSDGFGGLFVYISSNRKEVRISANSNKLSEAFGLGWEKTNEDDYAYSPIDTKTFKKKVSQLLIDGIGQDTGASETILYLMEDGTVEYTPIYKELTTNWNQTDKTKKFNSYGKLEGITDIISLIPANVPGKPTGGYHTILARKADGTVINLQEAFKKAGIINFG